MKNLYQYLYFLPIGMVARQLGCWDVLAQIMPIWAASIPGLGCQQPNLDVLDRSGRAAALPDLSGSPNSTFSNVSGAFWVAQETLLRSPRDAPEKPMRAQICPITLLAA